MKMKSQANDEGWWRFIKLCVRAKTSKQFEDLFRLFLTPEERNAISTRYQIIKELMMERKTQREIAAALKVSIAKITRGSNSLKNIDENLQKFLKTHLF